jgi:alkyldihydroxyacetonephosphate synthase
MADVKIARLRNDLSGILGPERVSWDEQALLEHAHDTWPLSLLRLHRGELSNRPACVVRPRSTAEVSSALAYANLHSVPVVPFGAASGVCGGILPSDTAIVLDLRDMRDLIELNEVGLVARVQAGTMGNRFERELNDRGYSLGHFPQSIDLSTVGGWVATRAAGQFSTRYGSIEDMLLGLEVVLADGAVLRIKAAPRRASGPDLRHLFLGSEGVLGVITELTVRVSPLPESRRLACFSFPDFDAGLEAVRSVMRAGWRPPVLRLYDVQETARHFGQWASDDNCFLLIVSEGPAPLTTAEIDACHDICRSLSGQPLGDDPVKHWLAERNNVPSLMGLIEKGFVFDTIEVATNWDRIHDLYREVTSAVRSVKNVIAISGHSSHCYTQGTNIYFTFVARPDDPREAEATYFACWEKTMEATLRCGATISHHHGVGRMRLAWMGAEHGKGLDILRAVKRALDPNGIMNPGVLLPDDAGR